MLPYYKRDQKVDSQHKNAIPDSSNIVAIYLSEFHFYILRSDCITIVNLISGKLIEHRPVHLFDHSSLTKAKV